MGGINMNRKKHRIISSVLAFCTICCCLLPCILPLTVASSEFPNTYVNTGDQRKDILGVALTQIGFTEGPYNKTPYGAWYGLANQSWCASFISWCATQADVGTHILARSAVAAPDPEYFNIPQYDGAEYTPLPGDLFFTKDYSHTGFVYYVEGEYFYTVEGNTNLHDPDNPKPSDAEGLYVMTNRRRTKDYYFGVPAYEGGDMAHTYVKEYETAHPHKSYYSCTTCGDMYYTGYTGYEESCPSCLPCTCSSDHHGYYTTTAFLNITYDHSAESAVLGHIISDELVYVYGADPDTGRAYVNYDGKRGHIKLAYLAACAPIPDTPNLSPTKNAYILGDTVHLTWDYPQNTEFFQIRIWKDGILQETKQLGTATEYALPDIGLGNYSIYLYAINKTGASEAAAASFSVQDPYWVSYDAQGGINGPEPQAQVRGHAMVLSETVPVRSGYTFLGWSDNKESNIVTCKPGDSFSSDDDTILYAVWEIDVPIPQDLSIEQRPIHTQYLVGETLNTEGLALRLLYSDGTSQIITEGYTTEGFSSVQPGTATVIVTYEGLTVSFDVHIMSYPLGDIDLNGQKDRDDVMLLLWHISFPDKFPITVPADFTNDGKLDRDDVMQLLWHISFPDKFPLVTELLNESSLLS